MMESTECAVEINLKGTSDVKKKRVKKPSKTGILLWKQVRLYIKFKIWVSPKG